MARLLVLMAVLAAYAFLLRGAPTNEEAVLRTVHVVVILTILLGVAGLVHALGDVRRRRRWSSDSEGLVTFSLLTLAWGHLNCLSAIRRAALLAGYKDAAQMDYSNYRLFAWALVIVAVLAVLRWATRRDFAQMWRWPQHIPREVAGELPWAAGAVFLMLFVAFQTHVGSRLLVWLYRVLVA